MTSIILVSLGILLAAGAALMVVFYGGDAYNSGNARAAANTMLNLGANVMAAVDLYRVQEGRDPEDPGQLVEAGYMEAVDIGSLGRPSSQWRDLEVSGRTAASYVVSGVDVRICDEIASRGSEPAGCVEDDGDHVFYMRVH